MQCLYNENIKISVPKTYTKNSIWLNIDIVGEFHNLEAARADNLIVTIMADM